MNPNSQESRQASAPVVPAASQVSRRLSLRQLDTQPGQYGFQRSRCGCPTCSVSCKYIPGFLTPEDLPRLAALAGVLPEGGPEPLLAWARLHLRASPGAVIARRNPVTGEITSPTRVPTLVPARHGTDLACHWLGRDGGCAVHEASPYGCAYFDSHMAGKDADERSMAGIQALLLEWQDPGDYAAVWTTLQREGLVAPGPGESRQAMAEATGLPHAPMADDNPDQFREVQLGQAGALRRLAREAPAYYGDPDREGERPEPIRNPQRHGRNSPCPCGSGKKFKVCHGRQA